MTPLREVGVSNAVIRSLYRSLMREAALLDSNTVLKTFMPLPRKTQQAISRISQLYAPETVKYTEILRKTFRHSTSSSSSLGVGFELLTAMKRHREVLNDLLPRMTQSHEPLMARFQQASQNMNPALYTAKPISVPLLESSLQTSQKAREIVPKSNRRKATSKAVLPISMAARCAAIRQWGFDLKLGMGLIAHPLSSAHLDRRVMILTELTSSLVTGLVLDMPYTYPVSDGSPLFPDVFWQHSIYNGGFCHVDFTMPPTANVSILHTLEPSNTKGAIRNETNEEHSWFSMKKWPYSKTPEEMTAETKKQELLEHSRLCLPLIRTKDNNTHPHTTTLYYSKVESIPYLARLAVSQPRSSVRLYWGCMRWTRTQLLTEIVNGHWIPVDLSPNFFSAYALPSAPGQSIKKEEHFATEQELETSRQHRQRTEGTAAFSPQTFPPQQPQCRREPLWDQIAYALGGEYQKLVGSLNPFMGDDGDNSSEGIPLTTPPPSVQSDRLRELAEAIGLQLDDDDDDDNGDNGKRTKK